MTRASVVIVLMSNAIVPASARAQAVDVSPLVSVAQEYDSNLFSVPINRQRDLITRVSPGLESAYRTPVLTMVGHYTFDVERFASHPELTTVDARQRAGTTVTYRLTPQTAIAADAELLRTQTPAELNALTNVTLARARARRVMAHSSIAHHFNMVTAGSIDYVFTADHIAGAHDIRSHAVTIDADRHWSPRDVVSVNYRLSQFQFGTSSSTSHALSLAWTRAITPLASVSLGGGPRATDGSLAPNLSASIRYRLQRGEWSLAYARTQTTVIGLADVADAQSLAATAAWHPRPSLRLRLSPAAFRTARPAVHAGVYQLTAGIERRIARDLWLEVALSAFVQHGNLYTAVANETIPRQNVVIRLVAAPATRPRS
jgi:hypothetical protein